MQRVSKASSRPTSNEKIYLYWRLKNTYNSIQSKSHKNRVLKICVSQLFAHSFFVTYFNKFYFSLFFVVTFFNSKFFFCAFYFICIFQYLAIQFFQILLECFCCLLLLQNSLINFFSSKNEFYILHFMIFYVLSVLFFLFSFNLCFSV